MRPPTILVWRSTQAPHCKSFIGLKGFALPEYGVILDMTRVQMQGVLHCEVIMRWNRIGTLVHRLSSSCLSRSPIFQPHVLPSPHMASTLDSDITFASWLKILLNRIWPVPYIMAEYIPRRSEIRVWTLTDENREQNS
jgi:hypothetical protein